MCALQGEGVDISTCTTVHSLQGEGVDISTYTRVHSLQARSGQGEWVPCRVKAVDISTYTTVFTAGQIRGSKGPAV